MINSAGDFSGVQVAIVGNLAGRVALGEPTNPVSRGGQIAVVGNEADEIYGLQAAGLYNRAKWVRGVQIGVFNWTDRLSGVQIGLINVNREGPLLFFPIIINFNLSSAEP